MTPVLAFVMLVGGGLALVISQLGAAAVFEARAQTAADAAALAAVAAGPAAAHQAAVANGARIIASSEDGSEVEVTTSVGRAAAVARARREQPVQPATGKKVGLAPAMLAAVARAEQLLGRELPIVSGLRTTAEQRRLWENRHVNPYPVAPPGRSRHEQGLAIDIPRSFVATLLAVAPDAGLCRPLPVTDPIHFELCPNP